MGNGTPTASSTKPIRASAEASTLPLLDQQVDDARGFIAQGLTGVALVAAIDRSLAAVE
jgi:hypothetical protein